ASPRDRKYHGPDRADEAAPSLHHVLYAYQLSCQRIAPKLDRLSSSPFQQGGFGIQPSLAVIANAGPNFRQFPKRSAIILERRLQKKAITAGPNRNFFSCQYPDGMRGDSKEFAKHRGVDL